MRSTTSCHCRSDTSSCSVGPPPGFGFSPNPCDFDRCSGYRSHSDCSPAAPSQQRQWPATHALCVASPPSAETSPPSFGPSRPTSRWRPPTACFTSISPPCSPGLGKTSSRSPTRTPRRAPPTRAPGRDRQLRVIRRGRRTLRARPAHRELPPERADAARTVHVHRRPVSRSLTGQSAARCGRAALYWWRRRNHPRARGN